jgi:hypothetical protein
VLYTTARPRISWIVVVSFIFSLRNRTAMPPCPHVPKISQGERNFWESERNVRRPSPVACSLDAPGRPSLSFKSDRPRDSSFSATVVQFRRVEYSRVVTMKCGTGLCCYGFALACQTENGTLLYSSIMY